VIARDNGRANGGRRAEHFRLFLAGAVPAAVLALLVQAFFEILDRWLIPAGLRNADASVSG